MLSVPLNNGVKTFYKTHIAYWLALITLLEVWT